MKYLLFLLLCVPALNAQITLPEAPSAVKKFALSASLGERTIIQNNLNTTNTFLVGLGFLYVTPVPNLSIVNSVGYSITTGTVTVYAGATYRFLKW